MVVLLGERGLVIREHDNGIELEVADDLAHLDLVTFGYLLSVLYLTYMLN